MENIPTQHQSVCLVIVGMLMLTFNGCKLNLPDGMYLAVVSYGPKHLQMV